MPIISMVLGFAVSALPNLRASVAWIWLSKPSEFDN